MRKLVTFLLVLASVSTLSAVPSLTTIQDILYKADGTRFNGTVSIQWKNFQAGDTSIVATQQVTLQVVNGEKLALATLQPEFGRLLRSEDRQEYIRSLGESRAFFRTVR